MSGVWKNRIAGLWDWFTESGARLAVVLLVVGLAVMAVDVPLWMAVFVLLTVPFDYWVMWAIWNRRAPKEMADKAFSFCLPGYRESLRRCYFIAATYVGLGAVPFGLLLCWIDLSVQHAFSVMGIVVRILGAFFVGAAAYLCIGVDFRFVVSRLVWNLLRLLSIPLFLIAVIILSALIEYPALGILLGLALCVFMWFRLGDVACVRRGHRMIVQDALERQAQVGVTRTVSPAVEGLFLRLVKSVRGSMTATHLWGGLYRTFGLILSYWKWLLFSIVCAALVLGYTGESNAFVALGLVALVVRLPIFSGMLLPEGRKEKPRLAIAVAVVTTVWLMVMASLVVALSWCLVGYMPHAFGTDYAGLDPWNIALPSALVPWLFVLQLLFAEELNSMSTIAPLIAAVSMTIVALFAPQILTWIGISRVIVFGVILISGWAFFLPILRRVCTSGDLSGQGPCVVV